MVPGGITRTPVSATLDLGGILSWKCSGPAFMGCISATRKYSRMASFTQAWVTHSPSIFSATRSSPRSTAATVCSTAARVSALSSLSELAQAASMRLRALS